MDPKLASRRWCAYAWPSEYGRSGTHTFVIDQDGNDLCVDDPRYSGSNGPAPGAAFVGGSARSIMGSLQAGVPANDGNVWTEYGVSRSTRR